MNLPPGRKKIVIPQFRQASADCDAVLKMWQTLESAILQIFAKEQSNLSYEVLYRNAYNMVLHKHGEKLYTNVRHTVAKHLVAQATSIAGHNTATFMSLLQQEWKDFKLAITMVRDVCMYLDRTWVDQQKVAPVYDLGLGLFRDLVARDDRIRSRLLTTMLGYIEVFALMFRGVFMLTYVWAPCNC